MRVEPTQINIVFAPYRNAKSRGTTQLKIEIHQQGLPENWVFCVAPLMSNSTDLEVVVFRRDCHGYHFVVKPLFYRPILYNKTLSKLTP